MVDPMGVAGAAIACKSILDTSKSVAKEADEAIGWVSKVKNRLGPFKPEIINFSVNYRSRRSELKLSISVDEGIIRKVKKNIEIPAYQDFQISEMMDDNFHIVEGVWETRDGKHILKTSCLPKTSQRFLIQMSGIIPNSVLQYLVRIQPSANPNRNSSTDKYWIVCHLRDTNILEKWWDQLNINDIDIGVKVVIQRCFTNSVPRDVMDHLEAQREWIRQGYSRRIDREAISRAHRKSKVVRARSVLDLDEIYRLLVEIASAKNFKDYVSVETPYQVQNVFEDKNFDFYPEKMNVDVNTELNFNTPTAKGNLIFRRSDYEDNIRSRIQEEKDRKKK